MLKARGFDPQGHEAEVGNLEKTIRNGDALDIYMTKRIADVTAHDGLLDHWGVHHLHLGAGIDQRTGLIRRTRHILLCRFDNHHVYFIKVAAHGSDSPNTWYQKELIEIIHRNWPESIESARIKGATSVEHRFDDEDTKELRNANVNVLFQVSD